MASAGLIASFNFQPAGGATYTGSGPAGTPSVWASGDQPLSDGGITYSDTNFATNANWDPNTGDPTPEGAFDHLTDDFFANTNGELAGTQSETFTLSGLNTNPLYKYDLYFIAPNATEFSSYGGVYEVGGNTAAASGAAYSDTAWVAGQNFAVLTGISANSSGEIEGTIQENLAAHPENYGIAGMQVVEYAPTIITPTAVTQTAGLAAIGSSPPERLIDGSGLSEPVTVDNYSTVTHGTAVGDHWVTNQETGPTNDYFDSEVAPVLEFQLDEIYELTHFMIWGYPFGGSNEAQEFTLDFSLDGGSSYYDSVNLSTLSATQDDSTTLDLGNVFEADFVRVTITDNYDGNRVGLGEVRFVVIPEPGSMALMGLGILCLITRRRNHKA